MSSTAAWLLEIGGLTVGPRDGADCDIVSTGQSLAAQLRTAAAAHLAASGCGSTCARACALEGVDGGPAACRLAVRLVAGPTPPGTSVGTLGADGAAQQYLQAVRAAATSVFHCRRHAHQTGECWFSPDGSDLCGDVLAVAHRVGA